MLNTHHRTLIILGFIAGLALIYSSTVLAQGQTPISPSDSNLSISSVFKPKKVNFVGEAIAGKTILASGESYVALEIKALTKEHSFAISNPHLVASKGDSISLFAITTDTEMKKEPCFWSRLEDIRNNGVIAQGFFKEKSGRSMSKEEILIVVPQATNVQVVFKDTSTAGFLFVVPKGEQVKTFDFIMNKINHSILLSKKGK